MAPLSRPPPPSRPISPKPKETHYELFKHEREERDPPLFSHDNQKDLIAYGFGIGAEEGRNPQHDDSVCLSRNGSGAAKAKMKIGPSVRTAWRGSFELSP